MLLAELNLNNLSPWRPIVKKGKSGVLARIGLQSVLSILSGLLQVSQDQGVAHCFKDLAGVDTLLQVVSHKMQLLRTLS